MSKAKTCTICKLDKSITDFHKKPGGKFGVASWCKKCAGNKNSLNRNKKPVQYGQYWKTWLSKPGNVEKERIRTREKARLVRLDVLEYYGNKCECCGESRKEFLAVDHIDGKGKISKQDSGSKLFNRIRRERYPKGFRILCHNCNMSLGMYGYCPHKGKDI